MKQRHDIRRINSALDIINENPIPTLYNALFLFIFMFSPYGILGFRVTKLARIEVI